MAALYDSFHRNTDIRRGKIGRHLIKIGSSLPHDRLVARRRDFGAEFAPQFWRRFVHRFRQPIANDFRRSLADLEKFWTLATRMLITFQTVRWNLGWRESRQALPVFDGRQFAVLSETGGKDDLFGGRKLVCKRFLTASNRWRMN